MDDKGERGLLYGSHISPWKGTQPQNWDSHVGNVARKFPVFVGEVGCESDPKQENPAVWSPKILKYLDDNGLHWTGWTFHPSASPRMLQDWNYTPTPYWGALAKTALQNATRARSKWVSP